MQTIKRSAFNTVRGWRAVEETGLVPPGNAAGNTQWSARRARPEIRLTPGKGAADLTCSMEDLIDGVIKAHKARLNYQIKLTACCGS